MERILSRVQENVDSHKYPFDEKLFVFQRCGQDAECPAGFNPIRISDEQYPEILKAFNIKYPDPEVEKWTHGWGGSHYGFHHCVNLLEVLRIAKSDYIVFADGDCYIKDTPEQSWVTEAIRILEANQKVFVVCPNDGGPSRPERIMSQQMFIINRNKFLNMEFLPWDGIFPDGGPMAEYHFMLEGRLARFMAKHDLYRYVLPAQWRYWHLAYH